MEPQKVNPQNFKVLNLIFNNLDFSIAYGIWEDDKKYLAMRWNGEKNEIGYPNAFGNPIWFLIDINLKVIFLKSLLELPNVDKQEILKIIKEEI